MSDRSSVQGMIFSAPMVQALLAGRKTQTRRLLPEGRRPRIKVGDRIYVRESFRVSPDACEGWPDQIAPCPGWIDYAAGGSHYCHAPDYLSVLKAFGRIAIDWDNLPHRWHSARYMPRWCSRLFLTVADVRAQKLHDITEADALSEGIIVYEPTEEDPAEYASIDGGDIWNNARSAYASLWSKLHRDPETRWSDNPRVVAYTFTVTPRNVDVLPVGEALAPDLVRACDLPSKARAA